MFTRNMYCYISLRAYLDSLSINPKTKCFNFNTTHSTTEQKGKTYFLITTKPYTTYIRGDPTTLNSNIYFVSSFSSVITCVFVLLYKSFVVFFSFLFPPYLYTRCPTKSHNHPCFAFVLVPRFVCHSRSPSIHSSIQRFVHIRCDHNDVGHRRCALGHRSRADPQETLSARRSHHLRRWPLVQCPVPAERNVRRVVEHNRRLRAHLFRVRFAEPKLGHCGGHSVGKDL